MINRVPPGNTLDRIVPYLALKGHDPIPAGVTRECEPLRIPFDRRPFLDARNVGDRKRVFLDLSYWLDLAAESAPVWNELALVLRSKVEAGRVLAPVTSTILLELSKLTDIEQAHRCMDLISTLSLNVVFRDFAVRVRDEIAYAARNSHSPPQPAAFPWWFGFSIYPDLYGEMEIVSAPSPKGREVLETLFTGLIVEIVEKALSLRVPGQIGYPDFLRRAETRYEERMAEFRAGAPRGKVRFNEQLRVEGNALLNRLVAQQLNFPALIGGDEITARFFARYPTETARRKYHLQHAPSLRVRAEVLAAWAESGATYEKNDFFDIENLATAIPYSHFVTGDKMMRHVARRLRIEETYGAMVLNGPGALIDALRPI